MLKAFASHKSPRGSYLHYYLFVLQFHVLGKEFGLQHSELYKRGNCLRVLTVLDELAWVTKSSVSLVFEANEPKIISYEVFLFLGFSNWLPNMECKLLLQI